MQRNHNRFVWISALIALLLALIGQPLFAQQVAGEPAPVPALREDSCQTASNLVYVATMPGNFSHPPIYTAQLGAPAQLAGAVTKPDDSMQVSVNGTSATRADMTNGNYWSAGLVDTKTITWTAETGPDRPWVVFGVSGINPGWNPVSLGDSSNEETVENYRETYRVFSGGKVTGCTLVAFNDIDTNPLTFRIYVNGQKILEEIHTAGKLPGIETTSSDVDFFQWSVENIKVNDQIIVEINTVDNAPTQDREAALYLGSIVQGALRSNIVLVDTDGDGVPDVIEGNDDSDGDGSPDYLDPDDVPSAPGDCQISLSPVNPVFVNRVSNLDIQVVGNCGETLMVRHQPATLVGYMVGLPPHADGSANVCLRWDDLYTSCDISDFKQLRLQLISQQAGIFPLEAFLAPWEGFRYTGGLVQVVYWLGLPIVMR